MVLIDILKKKKKLLLQGFMLASLGLVLFLGSTACYLFYYFMNAGPLRHTTTVVIVPGTSVEKIGFQLSKARVIHHPLVFSWGVPLLGAGTHLQAGEYEFLPFVSPEQVYESLLYGKTVKHRLTIPEGFTTSEVLQLIENEPALKNEIQDIPQEGQLLPETYLFSLGDDRSEMIKRMRQAMDRSINQLWENRSPDLPYTTPQEAIIMASLIEKETAIEAERPQIAAVFLNRWRQGIKLQCDPTVIYGLAREKKIIKTELTRTDLEIPTPYNTYLIKGLPPSPICNPGYASLKAAFFPQGDALYFVADGTGRHIFSKDYKNHFHHHQNLRQLRKAHRLLEKSLRGPVSNTKTTQTP